MKKTIKSLTFAIETTMEFMPIPQYHIERYSGKSALKGVPVIKTNNYTLLKGVTVIGDAPKALIRIFNYSKDNNYKKQHQKKWPLYIAKTGHKWYPSESITERLLCRLGEVFGLEMAESSLAVIGGQLRFLSKYFLENPQDEELVHGADIFAGYVGDKDLVEKIEEEQRAREVFTLQFVEKSIEYQFYFEKENIMRELVKMLLFDILVGNNDRHFYNWAVIRSITQSFKPRFSPIYDTARGLFWNNDDESLRKRLKNNPEAFIKKYCKGSRPKIGWDGENDINHFKLLSKIYENEFYLSQNEIKALFLQCDLAKMFKIIDTEFSKMLCPERIQMIKMCLEHRYNEIMRILE